MVRRGPAHRVMRSFVYLPSSFPRSDLVGWPKVFPARLGRERSVEVRAGTDLGPKSLGSRIEIGTRTDLHGFFPAGPVREDLWPTYSMLRHSASGPEIGLLGRILAELLLQKNRNRPRPAFGWPEGRFRCFPGSSLAQIRPGRPISGPESFLRIKALAVHHAVAAWGRRGRAVSWPDLDPRGRVA